MFPIFGLTHFFFDIESVVSSNQYFKKKKNATTPINLIIHLFECLLIHRKLCINQIVREIRGMTQKKRFSFKFQIIMVVFFFNLSRVLFSYPF